MFSVLFSLSLLSSASSNFSLYLILWHFVSAAIMKGAMVCHKKTCQKQCSAVQHSDAF